jgi:UDP-N-acetylmuramate--alanine ligase
MQLSINKKDKIHLIGIGGIGMSGIALILKKMGYDVQGSDTSKNNKNLSSLRKKKIKIFTNHKAINVDKAKIVVLSTAIDKKNNELQAALKKEILVIKRADMLAHIISLKKNIVISGSHGKTTITSLVSTILNDAKFKPTIINGGIINSLKTNASLGAGEWSVIEADESDGSFLKFNNTIAIVSNIDHEHMDYYKSLKNLTEQFKLFLNKTPLFGKNIVCLDDVNVKKIIKQSPRKNFLTYGFDTKADFVPTNIIYKNMKIYFDLNVNIKKKFIIKKIALNLMGHHNVLNATAAIIASISLGISIKKIKHTLENFLGVQRRLTKVYEKNNRIIFDDYAHHPTEIEAVLSACKNSFKEKKIVSIFQPHRFTRVESLYKKFTDCFSKSDLVILCPVYAAGEKNINFNLEQFGKKIAKNSKTEVVIIKDEENLNVFLNKNFVINELIIAMGAGNISQWIRSISKKLVNDKIKN